MFAVNSKRFYRGVEVNEQEIKKFVTGCFKQVPAEIYAYRDENTLIVSKEESDEIIKDYIISFIFNTLAENDINEYYPKISLSFFWRMKKMFPDGFEIEVDKDKMQVFVLNKITKTELRNVVKNCFLSRKSFYSLTEPAFYKLEKNYEMKGKTENFMLDLKGDLYYGIKHNEKLVICDERKKVKIYEIYEQW